MISPPTRDQVIALAGVFQACQLVDTLAQTGNISAQALHTAMTSLLDQNPTNCEAVFGSVTNLSCGIDSMAKLLTLSKRSKVPEILRYVLGVLYLERKLSANAAMLDKVGAGVAQANNQAQHFSPVHENVINNLADLYSNTISTFRFRIQVSGQSGFLQQASIANRVRCMLFAGIRAGILWHQAGGRRWHFIFYRKRILKQLEQLRREL
ncbi:MAG: lysogenization regulator HflD [Gammaproteobacteria bacterium]|nr:MAG: lysogenization regulator HflD [Gammaproteobacteria bacterium]RLA42769.1 MAG: lysogenization regulator HflD [Gammaproteobacteria bacterium]